MNKERYNLLMSDDSENLTPEEIESGWHFCNECDGLLVGPEMGELRFCSYLPIKIARDGILDDLRRRWNTSGHDGVVAPRDIDRFYHPQTNYFCGSGTMKCPVCKTGDLKYERSAYNGHVRARCSTDGCVAWIE